MNTNIFDSHVHSNNSHDAKDSVELLQSTAKELGIIGFALTDHFECDDLARLKEHQAAIAQSVLDAQAANSKADGAVKITCGIELGQPHYQPTIAEDMLKAHSFDFAIGSVHALKSGLDLGCIDYRETEISIPDLLESYFLSSLELIDWGRFDALGHLGYPARYIQGRCGIPCDFKPYDDMIESILRKLIDKGIALEINAGGMRTGLSSPNPDWQTVERYLAMGGELLTISSDAHTANNLAYGLSEVLERLQSLNCKYFTYYIQHKPIMQRI